MRILLYTDVHFSKSSSIIRDRGTKYSKRLENIINSVNYAENEIVARYNVDTIICLGDFFDKPDLEAEEISALNSIKWSDKEHYFIVGNHESNMSNLLFSSTSILEKTKFKVVNEPERILGYGFDILLLPYITERERKNLDYYWKSSIGADAATIQEMKKRIILSHNDIKNIRYGRFLSKTGFDVNEIENNCNLFINGHLHNDGFVNDKETILNLGNLTGQNFNEDAFKYDHLMCVLDTSNLSMEFIENPYAFNFYKINIKEDKDLNIFNNLKNNAVVTVKCLDDMIDKVKKVLDNNSKITDYKIVRDFVLEEDNNQTSNNIEKLNTKDHLQQFHDFMLNNVENSDIMKEELSIVLGGN